MIRVRFQRSDQCNLPLIASAVYYNNNNSGALECLSVMSHRRVRFILKLKLETTDIKTHTINIFKFVIQHRPAPSLRTADIWPSLRTADVWPSLQTADVETSLQTAKIEPSLQAADVECRLMPVCVSYSTLAGSPDI